jgi:hypothetical protein
MATLHWFYEDEQDIPGIQNHGKQSESANLFASVWIHRVKFGLLNLTPVFLSGFVHLSTALTKCTSVFRGRCLHPMEHFWHLIERAKSFSRRFLRTDFSFVLYQVKLFLVWLLQVLSDKSANLAWIFLVKVLCCWLKTPRSSIHQSKACTRYYLWKNLLFLFHSRKTWSLSRFAHPSSKYP